MKRMRDIPRVSRMRLAKLYFFCLTNPKGCVLWDGIKDPKGYGRVPVAGKMRWAHEVYFIFFKSPLPDHCLVVQTCRNPACINPDHLKRIKRGEVRVPSKLRESIPAQEQQECPRCHGVATMHNEKFECWNCGKRFITS